MTNHLSIGRDKITAVTEDALLSLIDVLLYNDVDGDDEETKPKPDKTAKTWARLTVSFGAVPRATVGSSRFRQTGVAKVQIFAPKGQGAVAANDLAVLWVTQLLKATLPNGLFKNGNTKDIGIDGVWYNVNGSVEFEYVVQL